MRKGQANDDGEQYPARRTGTAVHDSMMTGNAPLSDKGRLRIAWFANGFPVMSEPFIALQAAELVARGHDLRLFGLSNLPVSPPSSSRRVQSLLEGRSANARWPGHPLARALAAPAVAARTARKAGLARLPALQPRIFRRTWLDLTSTFQGDLVAGEAPFDILHCQFATLGEHVIKLRDARLLSGRLVVHFRGYDITQVVRACGRNVHDHLWTQADRFIANCEHFRDLAVELGCPDDKIDVVGSGIELDSFAFRPPLAIAGQRARLIAVGRLTKRKGFHTLIEAVARLVRGGFDCELTLVGGGEERGALESLASRCGIGDRVAFTGPLPHAEISVRLASSHIFVAPSETSPDGGADAPTNTIKEAMAVGVPTCATRHGGIPELVEDGVTGVLAREADPEDLAAAILRLAGLEASWPELALNARSRVEARYETSVVTEKLLATYRRVMENEK